MDGHQAKVVAGRCAAHERVHVRFDGLEDARCKSAVQCRHELRDGIESELFFRFVFRFGHAIGEEDERVAGLEGNRLIAILGLGEESDDHVGGRELLDAALRDEEWRDVARVRLSFRISM